MKRLLMVFPAAMAEEEIHTLAEQDGLYGLTDGQGKVVVPCEYELLHCMVFRGTMKTDWRLGNQAPDEGLWGLYTIDGTELAPCEWETLEDLGDGQFKGTKSIIIDLNK